MHWEFKLFCRHIKTYLLEEMGPFKWLCLLYAIILCQILPWSHLLSPLPSTGGDIGSHFYPLHAILKSATLRPWNPGNLGGEPLLVHYFPLPFMIMAFFSLILPAGMAFNWLYILPVLSLPFCIYTFMRKIKSPPLASEFAFLLSIIFIFNTSYAAWGGNIFSTLAGQFAHAYALCFLFILMGVVMDEFQKNHYLSLKASFLVAAIVLSHAYVALCLPVVAVVLILLDRTTYLLKKITLILLSGFMGFMLSLWWLIPSLTNAPWTTPYASSWLERLPAQSYFPEHFKIVTLITLVFFLISLFNSKARTFLKTHASLPALSFLGLAAFYYNLVKIFPLVGLVDIRAIPQVHLFVALSFACILGSLISLFKKIWLQLALVVAFLGSYALLFNNIEQVVKRLEWNWSGWENKIGYDNFHRLNEYLKADFSTARVAFEHSRLNHRAGTLRSLEMLPYFSGRSVTEGLYMQATAFAPSAFYFQSLLGMEKSCPFPNYPCGSLNLKRASELMPLLGIQDLVISSPLTRKQIEPMKDKFALSPLFYPWNVARLKETVSLVEIMHKLPLPSQQDDWKKEGMSYVQKYTPGTPWVYVPKWTPLENQFSFQKMNYSTTKSCTATVKVSWNLIKLTTTCPGTPHVIKLSFHPSFRTNNKDSLYLILPSYIGITPSQNEVDLHFGQSLDWKLSKIVSLIALGILVVVYFYRRSLKKTEKL